MAFLEYNPTETLYQFSSVEGFQGMITSKEIWCTDLAAANDPRELALGHQHFVDAIKFVRKNEFKGTPGNFLDRLEQHVTNYRQSQQTFCTCFSPLRDDLPIWREYGSNYSGVAVGFRPTAIASMPGRIQKVKYLNPETPKDFRKVVREAASKFDAQHSLNDPLYWLEAGVNLFTAITALKHHSWAYEKEIRFIHAQVRQEPKPSAFRQIAEFSDETPVLWAKPMSRSRSNRIVEYKSFPFGRRTNGTTDPSRAIERVVIGPRCTLTEADVKSMLWSSGFEGFEVEKSECLIR
jgi:Protein of unknown function (DUF2971)